MKKREEIIGKIVIDQKEFPIIYKHKKRYQRYTYYRFKEDHFLVTSFFKINKEEVVDLVNKFALKLVKRGVISKDLTSDKINKEFVYILGSKYLIDSQNNVVFNDKIIKFDKNYYKNLIKIIRKDIEDLFDKYRVMMNVPPIYKLSFRNMKTRLGTNSKRTYKITLSYELLSFSLEEISSVIVHELAHYYYFDHSKNFYNCVYKYLPNYDYLTKKIKRRIYQ